MLTRALVLASLVLLPSLAWAQPVTHEGTVIAEVEDHPDKVVVRYYVEDVGALIDAGEKGLTA